MGLFSRKPEKQFARAAAAAVADNVWIGRKFRASEPLDVCLATYEAAIGQFLPLAGVRREIDWTPPPDVPGFQSTQGGPPSGPPARVVGHDLASGGTVYLAMWAGSAAANQGSLGSALCEQLWYVPPGFNTDEVSPIGGTWKTQLPSLGSIGWVERPYWGVADGA
jgi:hypothetical protein